MEAQLFIYNAEREMIYTEYVQQLFTTQELNDYAIEIAMSLPTAVHYTVHYSATLATRDKSWMR